MNAAKSATQNIRQIKAIISTNGLNYFLRNPEQPPLRILECASLVVVELVGGSGRHAFFRQFQFAFDGEAPVRHHQVLRVHLGEGIAAVDDLDRKSTRLNSSHVSVSYAVFCL